MIEFMRRLINVGLVLFAACSLSACATHRVTVNAAQQAMQQLDAAETDVARKIEGENKFYEKSLDDIRDDLARARESFFNQMVLQKAEDFVERNQASSSAETHADALRTYITSLVSDWKQIRSDLNQALLEAQSSLEENRAEVRLDEKKVLKAQNILHTLSASRSNKDLVKYMLEYAQKARQAYANLSTDSADAATTGDSAAEAGTDSP